MARINNLNSGGTSEVKRRLKQAEVSSNLGHSSISRGALKVNSVEGLQVDGSSFTRGRMEGSGTFDWTGPMWLRGAITGVGAFTFSGPCTFTGATLLNGKTTVNGDLDVTKTLNVTGTTRLRATTTVEANLNVSTGGQINAGDLNINPAGRIYSASTLQLTSITGTLITGSATVTANMKATTATVTGALTAGSLTVTNSKQFVIDHPTRPGYKLGHGSTESPVSGIEYWGEGALGDDGITAVELPEYFDALARKFGRIALVAGNGFIARWTRIDGNTFTVSGGQRGDEFTWLVKAERTNAGFPVEFVDPDYSGANSVQ